MPVRNNTTDIRFVSPRELMGSCALHPWPSWRDCEDGKLFGVLPNGEDRPAACPTHRDMEKGFPPRVFLKILERKAGVKIPRDQVRVTPEGIYIKGGDELGTLVDVVKRHWPNQKYWLRPDCIWLLPNR